MKVSPTRHQASFPIPQSSLSNTKPSAQRAKITKFKGTPEVLLTLQNSLQSDGRREDLKASILQWKGTGVIV